MKYVLTLLCMITMFASQSYAQRRGGNNNGGRYYYPNNQGQAGRANTAPATPNTPATPTAPPPKPPVGQAPQPPRENPEPRLAPPTVEANPATTPDSAEKPLPPPPGAPTYEPEESPAQEKPQRIVAPNPDADIQHIVIRELRSRYRRASILRDSDKSFLTNSRWSCWSHAAQYNNIKGKYYRFSFKESNGALYSSYDLNTTSSNPSLMGYIPKRGLISVNHGSENIALDSRELLAVRMTSLGNLIIETTTFNFRDFSLDNHPPSITYEDYPGAFVGTYISCTHDAGSQILAPGIPGRCLEDGDEFNTEQGGCYHFTSGNSYSMSPPWNKMTYYEADKYCKNLVEGGKDSWFLPERGDLRKLAGNVHGILRVAAGAKYWTNSNGTTPLAILQRIDSDKKEKELKSAPVGAVVCAYRPPDGDKDGVPDASDLCRNTKTDEIHLVAHSGVEKGCSPREAGSARMSQEVPKQKHAPKAAVEAQEPPREVPQPRLGPPSKPVEDVVEPTGENS